MSENRPKAEGGGAKEVPPVSYGEMVWVVQAGSGEEPHETPRHPVPLSNRPNLSIRPGSISGGQVSTIRRPSAFEQYCPYCLSSGSLDR